MSCFSEEDDLDQVWPRIIQQSNEKANWRLEQAGSDSVNLILAKIQPRKKEDSQAQDLTKKVFEKSLICVKRFGGVVAQTTSMVFGPSQQCFNAVSFVIDAVQKYEEVFANVTILMERMSAFLERLRTYLEQREAEEKLDRRLRVAVYRVLEHFLTILGIWHRLTTKKTAKFTLGLKIAFFGEDDGVKDAMANLEKLVVDVTRAEVTAIFQTVSASARNLQVVEYKLDRIGKEQEKTTASIGRLETADEEKKRLEGIREALGIDSNKRPWTVIHDSIGRDRVPDTAQWLLTYDKSPKSFVRWADSKQLHLNVLAIVGGEQYGKSYLCSAVISHLLERYGDDPRIGVAYYYLQRDATDKSRVNAALKAIIYQLASASSSVGREYARTIQKPCVDHKNGFGKSSELWNRLVAEAAKNINGTFFIVVDGVDDEAELDRPFATILEHIMSLERTSPLQIRLLFTSRPEDVEAFKHLSPRVPQIDMIFDENQPPLNQEDILVYAQHKLGQMLIFKRNEEYVTQLMDRAKNELGNGVRGDYFALNAKLDTLAKSRTPQDILEVLGRAKETRAEEIARDITLLNNTLRDDEIRELNDLLTWESVCFESMNLDQYKAILDLNSDSKPLIDLDVQIKDRYFRLFKLDDKDKMVTLKSADIRKHLHSTNHPSSRDKRGHTALHGPIQEGEAALLNRLIKRFLKRSFGGNEIYEKFGFGEFFAEKSGAEAVRVRLASPAENHVHVARGRLIAICDHLEEQTFFALREYAWQYFVDHLLAERDPDQDNWIEDVASDVKQDIGRKLVRVLRDNDLITSHADEWCMWSTVDQWILTGDYSNAVVRWLRDADVQKGLRDMPTDRQWVSDKCADTAPAVGILHDIIRILAQRWYDRQADCWGTSRMLCGYLSKIGSADLRRNGLGDLSVDQISTVETWAKELLVDCNDEIKWNDCLASTLRAHEHPHEAAARYRAMIELGDQDWRTRLKLAQTLKESKEPNEGINELMCLIQQNQASLHSDDENEFKTEYWQSVLPVLGQCYTDIEDLLSAERTYRKMLNEAVNKGSFKRWAMDAVSAMAMTLNKQTKHEETIRLLEDLAQHPDEEFGSWLYSLLRSCASEMDLHRHIRSAACSLGKIDPFVDKYQAVMSAVQAKTDTSELSVVVHLRYHLARLLRSHDSQEKQEMALKLWEENLFLEVPEDLENSDEGYEIQWAQSSTAEELVDTLLGSAKAAGLSTPMNPAATMYAERLEALVSQKNVPPTARYYLGRLRYLAGDAKQSRDVTRQLAQDALDGAETKTGWDWCWTSYCIARLLQLLDEDVDALAAWQSAAPSAPNVNGQQRQNIPTNIAHGTSSSSPQGESDSGDQSAQNSSVGSDGTRSGISQASGDQTTRVKFEDAEGNLTGVEDLPNPDPHTDEKPSLNGSCDACNSRWNAHGSLWACRECMHDFCPECYDKFKAGLLEVETCDRSHPHFHVSFLTEEEWRKVPPDSVLVAGKYISKKQWIEKVKAGWGIDEKSVAAAKKIQGFWRNSSSQSNVDMPTLGRRQTTVD